MNDGLLEKHSVRIAGHATSISLEAPFWQGLREIAARRRIAINALLTEIDHERHGNLSSAIRIFVLECCRRGELRAQGFARRPVNAHPDTQHHTGAVEGSDP